MEELTDVLSKVGYCRQGHDYAEGVVVARVYAVLITSDPSAQSESCNSQIPASAWQLTRLHHPPPSCQSRVMSLGLWLWR